MVNKWRPYFIALALDIVILTLLVFYKFNFIFPDGNQLIFSGDFIRPITIESATKYYVYPFVLNEHGGYIDPITLIKIPYWFLFTLIASFTSLNIAYWLLIVFTQTLSSLLISISARTLISPEEKFSYYLIPLIPSIFLCLSYPINYRPYWLYLPLLPGLMQYALIISYKTLTTYRLNLRTKIFLILIGYVASLQIQLLTFILVILAFVFFATTLLQKKGHLKNFLSVTFWLCLPLLFLSIIPNFILFINRLALSPSYMYSFNVLNFMSLNANMVNAFTFSVGFWEKVVYTNFDKLITLFIVSFGVTLYLFTIKKKAFFLSILTAFIISISFELGINNPVYKLLADPSNPFAWILRDPFKISLISLGLFTTIFTFFLTHLSTDTAIKNKKGLVTLFMALTILSITIWSPADKTFEIIQPSTIPKEYFTAINYLNENTDGPLLFLPIDGKWYEWADNPYLQGSFLARSYYGAFIDYTATSSKEIKELLICATSTKNLGALSLVSSGIVIDTSMEGYGQCFDKMGPYIVSEYNEELFKFGDHLYFLPNKEYSRFRVVGDPLFLIASNDYKYVGSFGEFLRGNQGVIFFDEFKWLLESAEMIKVFSKLTEPGVAWSLGYTHEPLHGPWHYYLERGSIENWQSDYGKGLVFTWAASRLKENPIPNNNDLIKLWFFDLTDDINQWKNYTREIQFGALHPLTLDNGALKAELWNSTWGWKTISSPLIPVEYGNWYRWELQIKGENAHGVHIKIVEYDQEQKIINARQVKNIGSGNFDWNTITLDYTPEKPETRYIQFQIWHGHQTTQPLPNTIWIGHLKVYDLQRFIEPVTLDIPYTLHQTDQYVLLARIFQNEQGGKILVQNDQQNHVVNTWDQLNKFTWVQLDNTTLQKGQHKITLTNLEGFNAVNLFALVPAQEYLEAQTRLTETLQNKRIIHILEAESDMYREYATTTNKYGGEASNGETLEIAPDSKIWREIETVKPGNYTIAVRRRGTLNIKIDEQEYQTYTDHLDWTYMGPIHLKKGTHRIEITSPPTYLTQWNFEKDEHLEWKGNISNVQTLNLCQRPYEGATSLEAELNVSTWGWKTITSPLITVTPDTKYTWNLQIAGENAHKAHIKIVEYDDNKKPLIGQRMKGLGDGNFTWTTISFDYTPSQNATYIALQIWHGHETTQPLPNRIWLDDVQVTGYQPSDLDVVWIYSTDKENETLEDIFKVDETPAELLEYTKIDPTKYTAKINATKPFMLSFAESYDPLWTARVNGQKTSPIPLYSVINGFWIEETGIIDITIEYEPQRWFYMGSAISVTTLIACATYLTYDWTKNKNILKRVKKWSRSNSS
jgi:hypothetical protein